MKRRVERLVAAWHDAGWSWVSGRLLTLAGLVLAELVVRKLHIERPKPLDDGLVAWDGDWYRRIAESWYSGLPAQAARFFPLYPLIGIVVGRTIFLGAEPWALVATAWVGAFAAAVMLQRLARFEGFGRLDPEPREFPIALPWYLTLFPGAFALVFGYAEPLFLVCSIGAFFGLRMKRWWLAAACIALASATRPTGVLLAIPAAIEASKGLGITDLRGKVARAATLVAGPLTALAYLAYSSTQPAGFWGPIREQQKLRGDFVDPITRTLRSINALAHGRMEDGLHAPFVLLFFVLVALAWRWLPAAYSSFATAVVLLGVCAQNLNSIERYGLNAFPLVIVLALLARRLRLERLALTIGAGLLVSMTALALLGIFVP